MSRVHVGEDLLSREQLTSPEDLRRYFYGLRYGERDKLKEKFGAQVSALFRSFLAALFQEVSTGVKAQANQVASSWNDLKLDQSIGCTKPSYVINAHNAYLDFALVAHVDDKKVEGQTHRFHFETSDPKPESIPLICGVGQSRSVWRVSPSNVRLMVTYEDLLAGNAKPTAAKVLKHAHHVAVSLLQRAHDFAEAALKNKAFDHLTQRVEAELGQTPNARGDYDPVVEADSKFVTQISLRGSTLELQCWALDDDKQSRSHGSLVQLRYETTKWDSLKLCLEHAQRVSLASMEMHKTINESNYNDPRVTLVE